MSDGTAPAPAGSTATREQLDAWFRMGVFVTLLLIGFVATVRAYFAIERAIVVWFEDQWVPVAQAAFSVVMIVVVVYLLRAYVIARAR